MFYGRSFQASFSAGNGQTAAMTGTYNTTTKVFSLDGFNFVLTVGDALKVQATKVHFDYTPGTNTFAAAATGATVTANLFSGVQVNSTFTFGLTQSGFTISSLSLTASGTPTIGGYLSATDITLTVGGPSNTFTVTYGATPATSTVSGTIGVTLHGVSLLNTGVAVSASVVNGTYDFTHFDGTNPSGSLELSVTNFSLGVGGQITISAPGTTTVTPGSVVVDSLGSVPTTGSTPNSVQLHFIPLDPTNLTVTLTAGGITQTISDYTVTGETLNLPSLASYLSNASATTGTITATYAPSLVSIPTATVTFVPLNLTVKISNLAISRTGFTLGNATLSAASLGAVGGVISVSDPKLTLSNISFDSGTGTLLGTVSLTATGATLDFGSSITASVTHDPAAPQATVQDQFAVGAATTTLPIVLSELPANTTLTVTLTTASGTTPIAATQYAGFTSASKNLTVTLTTVQTATAGTLTVTYTVNHPLSGSYDLSATGRTLNLRLEQVAVNLPFASFSATGVVFSYQTGNTAPEKMLLGAKGVTLIIGPGSANTAGIQVTNATLALEIQDNAGAITYAFAAQGNIAVVGLPANTLAFSGNVSVQVSTLTGSGSDSIALSNTPGDALTLSYNGLLAQVAGSNISLSVGGVVTLSGNFLITRNSDGSKLFVGATGVNAFIGSPDQTVGLKISGVTLALEIGGTSGNITYALDTTAKSIALVGLGNAFTLSGSVEIRINNTGGIETDVIPLADSTTFALPFSGTSAVPLAFSGSMTLAVPGFASLTFSDFALEELAPVVTPSLTTTEILFGTSDASAFLGVSSPTQTGVNISGAGLALEAVIRTGANLNGLPAFSFALETTGGTASLINFPDLAISAGNLSVKVNTTGAGVATQTLTTAGGPVTLGFTDGSNGTDDERNLIDIEGNVSVSITNGATPFATLTGDFGFKTTNITDNTNTVIGTRFIIGAENVTASLGTANINLTLTGLDLGLIVDKTSDPTSYALLTTTMPTSTAQLNGVPNLTLSASNLAVTVLRNMAPATVAGLADSVHTSAGTVAVNVSGLGNSATATNLTAFAGTLTLAVHDFLSLTGQFSFSATDDGTQTKILVGATGVNAVWGTPDQSFGLQITNGQLLMAIYRPDGASPGAATYALDASANAALAGFNNITLSGNFDARLNTTNPANPVDESIVVGGATKALHFDAGTGATASFTGTNLTLQLGSFASVVGTFTFVKTDVFDNTGTTVTQTNFTVTATGVTAQVGLTDAGGFTGIELDSASFGLVLQKNLAAGTGPTYAFQVTGGTATLSLPGFNLTASNFVIEGNTTGAAITNQAVGPVTLNFPNANTVFDVQGHITGSIFNPGSATDSFASADRRISVSS